MRACGRTELACRQTELPCSCPALHHLASTGLGVLAGSHVRAVAAVPSCAPLLRTLWQAPALWGGRACKAEPALSLPTLPLPLLSPPNRTAGNHQPDCAAGGGGARPHLCRCESLLCCCLLSHPPTLAPHPPHPPPPPTQRTHSHSNTRARACALARQLAPPAAPQPPPRARHPLSRSQYNQGIGQLKVGRGGTIRHRNMFFDDCLHDSFPFVCFDVAAGERGVTAAARRWTAGGVLAPLPCTLPDAHASNAPRMPCADVACTRCVTTRRHPPARHRRALSPSPPTHPPTQTTLSPPPCRGRHAGKHRLHQRRRLLHPHHRLPRSQLGADGSSHDDRVQGGPQVPLQRGWKVSWSVGNRRWSCMQPACRPLPPPRQPPASVGSAAAAPPLITCRSVIASAPLVCCICRNHRSPPPPPTHPPPSPQPTHNTTAAGCACLAFFWLSTAMRLNCWIYFVLFAKPLPRHPRHAPRPAQGPPPPELSASSRDAHCRTVTIPDSDWMHFASPRGFKWRMQNLSWTCTGNITHPLPDGAWRRQCDVPVCLMGARAACSSVVGARVCGALGCARSGSGEMQHLKQPTPAGTSPAQLARRSQHA